MENLMLKKVQQERERRNNIKKILVPSSDCDRSIYVYLYRYTILFFENQIQLLLFFSGKMAKRR